MNPNLQIYPIGEDHIILSISYYNTSTCVSGIAHLQHHIAKLRGIRSIRPGMDCLLVELENDTDRDRLEQSLKSIEIPETKEASAEIIRIPVCYEPEFSLDLENISKAIGLSHRDIIHLHSSPTYTVWMIGFMPGYPYMGELPEPLQIPRKSNPDPKIPAGSVAIAEEYVGVYPFDSPGGWHIVGRTPLRLFDYRRTSPSLFHYGMRVQFYSITKDEFEIIHREQYA